MRPSAFFATLFLSTSAFAQLQSGTSGTSTKDVSKGSADVTADNTAAAAQQKEKKDKITEVSFNLGGLFAAGNSRSAAVTAGVKSKIKRGDHQFIGGAVANYARAATAVNNTTACKPMETT